ncbi:MAG TPA: hypothetical protein VNN08_20505 [Thermoanaerobaculia bacterium]|nr:hypothetical protein [Thermoanaerobaculia bacterium]
MRTLRTICLIMTTTVLAAASANAQITGGTAGIVTTAGSGTNGVLASATSSYPDVTISTGNTSVNSGFHIFNSSSELLRVQSNGFVGIGTTAPQVLLDLKGNNVYAGGQIRLQATDFDQITFYNSSNADLNTSNRLAGIFYDVVNTKFYIENIGGGPAGNKSLILNSTSGGGGNVGIGTTSPTAKLDVLGSSLFEGFVGVGTLPFVPLDIKANNIQGAGQIRLQSADYGQITFYNQNAASRLGGIYYDVVYGGLYLGSNSGNKYLILNSDAESGGNGGNVGIGTSTPTGRLQIGSTYPAVFKDASTYDPAMTGMVLEMASDSEIHIGGMQIAKAATPVIQTNTGTAGQSPLYLQRDSDNDVIIGGGSPAHGHGLQVQSTGMSNFAGSVTVASDVTVNGAIYANYQDVAEWVPAGETMPAGTVVVISDDTVNTVKPSTRAYDTEVAGVVSPTPGLLLGIAGASKAKIATTGRVKVRVDASKQPIRLGDLLVTSDRPGMAMKSEPLDIGGAKLHRPGTLVGKALEPLAKGEGEILVLLSLQ